MRSFFPILCSLALAGCVTGGDQPSVAAVSTAPDVSAAAGQGPQIVPREAADWTALNSIVEIKLQNLRTAVTERRGSAPAESAELTQSHERQTVLKVFPAQKLVTLPLSPGYNGKCQDRGEEYEVTFVASPGADVSEQLACDRQGPTRKEHVTANYRTSSKIAANVLTIDGKGRVQTDSIDTYKGGDQSVNGQSSVNAELHGVIQIMGNTCKVLAWRQTAAVRARQGNGYTADASVTKELSSEMTCVVTRAGS